MFNLTYFSIIYEVKSLLIKKGAARMGGTTVCRVSRAVAERYQLKACQLANQ